jgi:NADH-quinone oxidoreductase subunit M
VALVQEDIKKLIAYSSVAHMGYVTMGIFAANQQGVQGAIFQMLSHGWCRARCSCVSAWSTTACTPARSPPMAVWSTTCRSMRWRFMVFTMANVGLPGTSGFVGEFLTLMGVFQVNTWVALFATTGVILSAGYALWLYRRVVFGSLEKESLKAMLDLSGREKAILYPLIALTILFGVYPAPIFDVTAASVDALINNYTASLQAARDLALSVN